ncbi:hypothetical protein [Streptomyces sp. NPDC014733]|uniref:hypothetical protein n=1 Tax=Streptomyces sp. NPDC014733 TaxID=3364885 RepID=UPI0036F6910A
MKPCDTGVVAAMATLPCAVAVGTAAPGARPARSTRRTGGAGALIAGRHASAHPGVVSRLVAGVGIALVLVSQDRLKNSPHGESARAAHATVNRIGTSMLLMHLDTDGLTRHQWKTVVRRFPPGTAVIAPYPAAADPAPGPTVRLQRECPALQAVQLTCSREPASAPAGGADQRSAEAVRWNSPGGERIAARRGPVLPTGTDSAPRTVAPASSDGENRPEAGIDQLLRDALPPAGGMLAATAGALATLAATAGALATLAVPTLWRGSRATQLQSSQECPYGE